MPRFSQSTARRLAMRAVMLRPSTLTVMVSPILRSRSCADLALQRDQRLAGIIGAPPLAGDDARAGRHVRRIGDAAVAAQHPARSGRGLEIVGLDAVGRDDAAAQHRHAFERRARRLRRARRRRSAAASAAGMSRKKNDGAFSGSAAVNWRCRLPSISITVTSKARPRPSESMTVGVSAPGRWILAMASRSVVERCARQAPGERHGRAARQAAAPRKCRRRRQRKSPRCDGRRSSAIASAARAATISAVATHVAPARPAPLGGDLVAKQHRHRNVVGAAERPQRKGQRRQQAVDDRQRQRRRMQRRRDRQRNDARRTHQAIANGSAAPSAAPMSGGEQRDQHDLRCNRWRTRRRRWRRAPSWWRWRRACARDALRPRWRRRRRRPAAWSSATSVRNWVKRSTLRSSCGEALLRVRISQPASGKCGLRLLLDRRHGAHRSRRRPAAAAGIASAPGCRAATGRWRAAPPR